jgi:hypothetical protein
MARYAFPENSADMARYFEANPSRRLGIEQAKHVFGAVLIRGGINGYGPAGHVVFSLGNGLQTLECSGSGRGVGIQSINRIAWSHAGLAPVSYVAPAPTPPKPPAPPKPIVRDNMVVVIYQGQPHTFWIDQNGWLQHTWGSNTAVENMNKYIKNEKYDDKFMVAAAVNGDWLNVRVVCPTLPAPNGRRVVCFDYHPSRGWGGYAAVPR